MLRLSAENSGEKPIFRHEINGHHIDLRMDGLCVLELGEHWKVRICYEIYFGAVEKHILCGNKALVTERAEMTRSFRPKTYVMIALAAKSMREI